MKDLQLASELLEVIPPLVHFIRAEIRNAASSVLTVPQYRVLAHIRRGLNTVGAIAEHHGVSQPAMTKMVNGLEERGLVKRATDPEDTRQTILTLTEKGKKLQKKTWDDAQKRIAKRLEAIPRAEREAILQSLKTLSVVLIKKK